MTMTRAARCRPPRLKNVKKGCELIPQTFEDPKWLTMVFIDPVIGYGVFSVNDVPQGSFILEYKGQLKRGDEGEAALVSDDGFCGSFVYFFSHKKEYLCIDATHTCGLGKMVNDAPSAHSNCYIHLRVVDNVPRLLLFAKCFIPKGTELRYDYGDCVANLPWRKKVDYCTPYTLLMLESRIADDVNAVVDGLLETVEDNVPEFEVKQYVCPADKKISGLHLNNEQPPVCDSDDDQHLDEESLRDVSVVSSSSFIDFWKEPIKNDSGLSGDFPEFSDTGSSDDSDVDIKKSLNRFQRKRTVRKRRLSSPSNSDSDGEQKKTCSPLSSSAKKKVKKNPKKPVSETSSKSCNFDSNSESEGDENDVLKTDGFDFDGADQINSEEIKIDVLRSSKDANGKRIYDKKNYCVLCGQGQGKLFRHIVTHHKDSHIYKEWRNLMGKQKATFELKVRGLGNFNHNLKTLRIGGSFIVWRRPAHDAVVSHQDYLPCDHCLNFIQKEELWRHAQMCPLKKVYAGDIAQRAKTLLYGATTASEGASKELYSLVLNDMHKDQLYQIIINDRLVLMYASYMLELDGIKKATFISQRTRLLARLIQKVRDDHPNIQLMDIIQPEYFEKIVAVTKELGGFHYDQDPNNPSAKFTHPSVPLKIGYSLQKCVQILKGHAIKTRNTKLREDADQFKDVYTLEWPARISAACTKSQEESRAANPMHYPVPEDIIRLRDHLKQAITSGTDELKMNPCNRTWRKLAECLGSRLTTFNRRRGNEVFGILVSCYETRNDDADNVLPGVASTLSSLEKRLMESLGVVYVSGKRGKKVPVLFNKEEELALNLLVSLREKCGVNPKNPYIFAVPSRGSLKHLRGNDCMHAVLNDIEGLQEPERLMSTAARKYFATMIQIGDLSENDMKWVAEHMGHSVQVHHQWYRQHHSIIEKSKVARLLMAIDEGQTNKFAGKKLSEITLDDLPELEQELASQERDEFDDDAVPLTTEMADTEDASKSNSGSQSRSKWTVAEKKLVLESCHKHIISNSLPGKTECSKLLQNPVFVKGRKWTNIKDFVRNEKSKRSKMVK